ncbi:MAG TPA: carboxypeptidase-like regulatory domain-containing protein, partial [Pyrinomonadaceae bacterium]
MKTNRARRLARWLLLPPALFALACALLAPAEAGREPAESARDARRATRGAQEPQAREPEAASTVRGRVVYDETSRPARRARVTLVGEGGARREYGALTDARGEFRIGGVRAGTYFAFVDVPGVLSPVAFVSIDELRGGGGVSDLGEGHAFFDLVEVDGKGDVDVTVHARRGASIAGRVTYADGDPAVNVTVNLMRRDAAGRLQKFLTGANVVSLSGLRTDDRGMFRLTGLPPGEYVVGVSESVDHSHDGTRRRADDIPGMLEAMMGQQLLMTFHPSATSAKEAAAVKVAAGDERTDVDVRIP